MRYPAKLLAARFSDGNTTLVAGDADSDGESGADDGEFGGSDESGDAEDDGDDDDDNETSGAADAFNASFHVPREVSPTAVYADDPVRPSPFYFF